MRRSGGKKERTMRNPRMARRTDSGTDGGVYRSRSNTRVNCCRAISRKTQPTQAARTTIKSKLTGRGYGRLRYAGPPSLEIDHVRCRMCGNSSTSRIDGESLNSITRRSMPLPSPAVGDTRVSVGAARERRHFGRIGRDESRIFEARLDGLLEDFDLYLAEPPTGLERNGEAFRDGARAREGFEVGRG